MVIFLIFAAGYGLAVNALAYALFGIDKMRAEMGAWRIRESTLLTVALAGGWLGAKAGQRAFRHKTRKQPFARNLNAVGVAPLIALLMAGALVLPPEAKVGGRLDDAFERGLSLLMADPTGGAAARGPLPRRFGPGSGEEG